jgi:hypothetical protein
MQSRRIHSVQGVTGLGGVFTSSASPGSLRAAFTSGAGHFAPMPTKPAALAHSRAGIRENERGEAP